MKIVLVIEDDPVVRRAVAEVLLDAGYGVCEAWSADLIPAVPRLHVVVSDVVVGQRTDLETVTSWSRRLTDRFGVPVVLLTGRDDVVQQEPAFLGVADVIAKPFDVDDLLTRVDRAAATTDQRAA
jgi:CheY-like chemotaxis protein